VVSVFALILVVDLLAIVAHRYDLLPREDDTMELSFVFDEALGGDGVQAVPVDPTTSTAAPDGTVVAHGSARGLVVRAPGELVIRFRTADAGSTLAVDYRFGRRVPGAVVTVNLARVASRWGVDHVWRRTLDGGKRKRGKIRHDLADHVGWFELRIAVNGPAAEVGFELTLPEISPDPPPRSAPHRLLATPPPTRPPA
jgi:hypothetical protein